MPSTSDEAAAKDDLDESTAEEEARQKVEQERGRLQDFVKSLSPDDIRSGNWFEGLLQHALSAYTKKANWEYFQERYKGVPADGIVEQRIRMASRYAAIEGGLSAGAYTATVAATIGSLGGASPATVPTAIGSVVVDVAFLSQLQLRLAWDIAVLYGVPLDLDDPHDLWKLIRIAFTIKGGEVVREGAIKAVPALIRPLVKRFYSKGVLTAAKGLPVVGKFLLQRNVIKIGIPLVGVPLSVILNRYTTLIAGRHAREVFREEARIIELAGRLIEHSAHPRLTLWVAWLVIAVDGRTTDSEALLMRYLVEQAHSRHSIVDEVLASIIELDREDLWRRIAGESGDRSHLTAAARSVAEVDGPLTTEERFVIEEVRLRVGA